VSATRIYFLL